MVRFASFLFCFSVWFSHLVRPEICDFGYPQNSEIDTLKTYITTESIVSSIASDNAVSSFVNVSMGFR